MSLLDDKRYVSIDGAIFNTDYVLQGIFKNKQERIFRGAKEVPTKIGVDISPHSGRVRVWKDVLEISGIGFHEPAVNRKQEFLLLDLDDIEPLIEKLRRVKADIEALTPENDDE